MCINWLLLQPRPTVCMSTKGRHCNRHPSGPFHWHSGLMSSFSSPHRPLSTLHTLPIPSPSISSLRAASSFVLVSHYFIFFVCTMVSVVLLAIVAAANVVAQAAYGPSPPSYRTSPFIYHGCSAVDLSRFSNPVVFSDGLLTHDSCQTACQGHQFAALFPEYEPREISCISHTDFE